MNNLESFTEKLHTPLKKMYAELEALTGNKYPTPEESLLEVESMIKNCEIIEKDLNH